MTTSVLRHTDKGVYSADATELGIPVGDFPEEFTDGDLRCKRITLHRDSAGNVTHAEYVPFGGHRFRVLVWNV